MPETTEQTTNGVVDGQQTETQTTETQQAKVEFTEAQQAKVNDLVNQTYAKVWEKATAQIKELETRLTAASQAQQTPVVPVTPVAEKKDKKGEKSDESSALQAQLDELKQIAQGLRDDKEAADKRAAEAAKLNSASRIKEEFIRSSEKVDFFDRMSEFDHMSKSLQMGEDGRVVVLNTATGLPKLNSSVQPMTLEEFVQDYAKQKPWTVKAKSAEIAGGSGAGDNRRLDTQQQQEKKSNWAEMSNEEILAESEKVIAKQYQR